MSHARGVRSGVAAIACAAALLAALPYLLAGISGNFILFDDDEYILNNAALRAGLTAQGLRWAFTSFDAANWHPLTWLSHLLDVQLFGLDARGHHATSVLLHALNAALLFLAAHRLTGTRWRSALLAFLFAVHPLRVESVAWVSERKDVLAGLFFMLVLLAYERAARRGAGARSPWVVLFLALGLMAKPMLVTVPLVLLLLDVWPLGRAGAATAGGALAAGRRLVGEKLPLLALAVASGVVTVVAQRTGGAMIPVGSITPGARLSNALTSIFVYLGKTVWPAALALLYPFPETPAPWWKSGGAALALVAATACALRGRRRHPFLAVGWLWFVGMLLPVLGIVKVGGQAYADRYTYLPQIGILVAAVWGTAALARSGRAARLVPAAGAAAVVLLAALSLAQAGRWRDSETLFRHTLAVTSGNWLIHGNLGFVLRSQERNAEAEAQFREALRVNPGYLYAHNSLGDVLSATGRIDEAMAAYRAAIRIDPTYTQPHNNLGNAFAVQGRFDEAAAEYRVALRLDPGYVHAHVNLGTVLAAMGRRPEAVASFREAVRLRPGFPEAWLGLGKALAESGRSAEALAALRQAERLRPADPEIHERLADQLTALGAGAEAAIHRERARQLRGKRS